MGAGVKYSKILVLSFLLVIFSSSVFGTVFSIEINFTNNGTQNYIVTGTNINPEIKIGDLDPKIPLFKGDKVIINNAVHESEPFKIISKNSDGELKELLVQGSKVGTLEAVAEIDWKDNSTNGQISFNVTAGLINNLTNNSNNFGIYMSDNNTAMNGTFNIESDEGFSYCYQFDGDEARCTGENASDVCFWTEGGWGGLCDPYDCYSFTSNLTCEFSENVGFPCSWNTAYNYCEEVGCWSFDGSNSSACENNTIGKSCDWDASSSSCYDSWQGCSSFDSMMQCFDTGWCMWNGTGCTDPDFGGEETGFGGGDTGCFMFGQESFCNNVTGCVWSGGSCGGNTSGITCASINQTDYCNSVPFMDTCCAWTTGGCNATFSTGCWDNIQTPPAGAMYCEDYNAINNETVCNNISGTPWYMPCVWDNVSGACGFNTDDYFTEGDAYFEDIGSSSTCTAAGGVWQTETFISNNGNYLTDEWCEMGFGVQYESCDSSCWACEFNDTGGSWGPSGDAFAIVAATLACQGSALGYCQFTPDENAINELGWCDIPFELQASGCGVETNCEDYNYYSNASSECDTDADCKWMTDPANSNIGWCAGANAKSCDQDCGECNTQSECTTYGGGGSSACEWDSQAYYCKNVLGQGESASEICFNGIDDDNDGMIDCIDSDCMSDLFCGGSGGINCGTYSESNTSCFTQEGCTWVTDPYSDNTSDGWCDITGSNCRIYDDNEASCGDNETNGALGCVWVTSLMGQTFGICDVNFTAYAPCFAYDSNYSGCQTVNATCSWESTDGSNTNDNGWCNPKPFGCWSNYFGNSSGCIADSDCTWTNDSFSPQGGWCDPICFSLNTTACNADSTCESKSGFCEPAAFASGGCWANDGNKTACDLKSQCSYFTDAFANNNLSGTEPGGWCNDAFMMHHFDGMEDGMPTIIADDPQGCSLFTDGWSETMPASVDICGVGVKEMDAAYGFGVMMGSLENASFCNGKHVMNPMMFSGGGGGGSTPNPGVGNDTVSVYLYLDTDGTTTGSCNSGNGTAGFEFKFTYEAIMTSGNLSESKLAYKCNNGEWGTTGIGISLWPEKSCSEMGAVILAIDRESLEAEDGFNKTVSMRALVASSNTTGNEANVLDSAQGYYMQGSFDFIAEDCYGMVDLDGDGCLPSEDPDCMMFNKFGYIPFEDCYNFIDDNNDGLTDCDDPTCKYEIYKCNGTLEVDPNDNEPPQLAFLEVNPLPDGAFIMLDTFEPSNANVSFYHNDSTCTTLNSSIDEPGALAYKPWHDMPIDNYAFNSRAIGFDLAGNKTYYYKYKLCDISENCIVSACSNFTTPVNYADCGIKCKTFINDLDFKPTTTNVSQPLGNLLIQYDLGSDGDYDYNKSYGDASSQETLNNTGLVSIKIQNPNSTIDWGIECINGTIPKSVSFNSSQIDINASAGNGMIGMPTSDFKNKFQSDFNCEYIRITLPYNGSSIWHCLTDSTSSCTNVTNSSTLITTSSNSSTWQVDPSEVGFSFFLSDDTNPAPPSTTTGGDDTTTTDDTIPPPTTNETCDNDGICETGETSDNCSADCPVASDNDTVDVCNNDGVCDDGETSDNCSADCPVASDNDTVDVCNNNGVCSDGETSDNCPADCPAISDNDTGMAPLTADDENDLPILVGVAVVAILGILAVIYLTRGKGKGNDEEDLL